MPMFHWVEWLHYICAVILFFALYNLFICRFLVWVDARVYSWIELVLLLSDFSEVISWRVELEMVFFGRGLAEKTNQVFDLNILRLKLLVERFHLFPQWRHHVNNVFYVWIKYFELASLDWLVSILLYYQLNFYY